jgi:hypothetical protein
MISVFAHSRTGYNWWGRRISPGKSLINVSAGMTPSGRHRIHRKPAQSFDPERKSAEITAT